MLSNVKDLATKIELEKINKRLDKISNIPQVSKDTSLEQLIDIVNRILAKDKRR